MTIFDQQEKQVERKKTVKYAVELNMLREFIDLQLKIKYNYAVICVLIFHFIFHNMPFFDTFQALCDKLSGEHFCKENTFS